jgi:hypothetical protein
MEEKKYPLYRVSAAWDMDDYKDDRTSYVRAYKEDPGIEAVKVDAQAWWDDYIHYPRLNGSVLSEKNVVLKSLEVEYLGEDTWWVGWFQHRTFNIHLTDEELIKSFQEYVSRRYGDSLMGAEDAWRWKGPCRCGDCLALGVVTIDH